MFKLNRLNYLMFGTFILITPFSVLAGAGSTGGGNVVLCYNQPVNPVTELPLHPNPLLPVKVTYAEVLDVWKWRQKTSFKWEIPSVPGNYMQKVEWALNRLEAIDPLRASDLKKRAQNFLSDSSFADRAEIPRINDFTIDLKTQKNCLIKQAARQLSKPENGESKFQFDQTIFGSYLDESQKAALILHEIVLEDLRKKSNPNTASDRAQYFSFMMASSRMDTIDFNDYFEMITSTVEPQNEIYPNRESDFLPSRVFLQSVKSLMGFQVPQNIAYETLLPTFLKTTDQMLDIGELQVPLKSPLKLKLLGIEFIASNALILTPQSITRSNAVEGLRHEAFANWRVTRTSQADFVTKEIAVSKLKSKIVFASQKTKELRPVLFGYDATNDRLHDSFTPNIIRENHDFSSIPLTYLVGSHWKVPMYLDSVIALTKWNDKKYEPKDAVLIYAVPQSEANQYVSDVEVNLPDGGLIKVGLRPGDSVWFYDQIQEANGVANVSFGEPLVSIGNVSSVKRQTTHLDANGKLVSLVNSQNVSLDLSKLNPLESAENVSAYHDYTNGYNINMLDNCNLELKFTGENLTAHCKDLDAEDGFDFKDENFLLLGNLSQLKIDSATRKIEFGFKKPIAEHPIEIYKQLPNRRVVTLSGVLQFFGRDVSNIGDEILLSMDFAPGKILLRASKRDGGTDFNLRASWKKSVGDWFPTRESVLSPLSGLDILY